MSAPVAVTALLAQLGALGVVVALNDSGDGLKLTGEGHPPADLLEEVKALKPDLLAHLQGDNKAKAKAAAPQPSSSPDLAGKPGASKGRQNVRTLPDWESVAAQPGHCGSCARATPAPDWGPLMVVCGCPDVAFWPDRAPLALHVAHGCAAYRQPGAEVGTGYRAKQPTHLARLPSTLSTWEDLPSLQDDSGAGPKGTA